jgi:hypothetical protein
MDDARSALGALKVRSVKSSHMRTPVLVAPPLLDVHIAV